MCGEVAEQPTEPLSSVSFHSSNLSGLKHRSGQAPRIAWRDAAGFHVFELFLLNIAGGQRLVKWVKDPNLEWDDTPVLREARNQKELNMPLPEFVFMTLSFA